MLAGLITELGGWSWVVLGLILMILEVAAPGIFFLWFGIAAIIVGGLAILFAEALGLTWQIQVIIFLVLSVIAVFIGRKLIGATDAVSDEPLLNRRAEQMVGLVVTLEEATVNGRGRARVGDSLWRVNGPDLAAGTRVRITAVDHGILVVEAV